MKLYIGRFAFEPSRIADPLAWRSCSADFEPLAHFTDAAPECLAIGCCDQALADAPLSICERLHRAVEGCVPLERFDPGLTDECAGSLALVCDAARMSRVGLLLLLTDGEGWRSARDLHIEAREVEPEYI